MHLSGQEVNSYPSREDFVRKHEKLYYEKAKEAERFPLMVLTELKKAIAEGNVLAFKNISNLINCRNDVADQVSLKDFYDNAANPIRCTNLVILACKHNQIKILEYLFSSESKILDNLSIEIEKTTILPNNEDDQRHNAFYYAIRSGNIELLDTLINNWPENYFAVNLGKLDEILSTAYDELKLKNVALSEEMEIFVENQLIGLRFFSTTFGQDQNFGDDLNNTLERIELILRHISLLKTDYSSMEKVDEKFLFLAKSIAQNIHILKRQLKSTYDRLPWEEMEFCLVIFVSSHTRRQENNLFYRVTLNKSKILNYLEYFAKRLEDERETLKSDNNGQLARLPRLNRDVVIAGIISNYPQFEEFFIDYQQVRDNYSLKKISDHINLALSADPQGREGQLIIARVLQVIGEHLKNTLESPKLSRTTSELFLLSLSKNARKIIIDLRDSLSHADSLSKRMQIEENADIDFFVNIQNDTKRIGDVITDILYKNKIKSIRILLKKIADSQNSDEVQETAEELRSIEFDGTIAQKFKMSEDDKFEKLIKELSDKIVGKTIYEVELFNKIFSLMNGEATSKENIITDYVMGFMLLKSLSNGLQENRGYKNNINAMQFIANKTLQNITPKIKPNRLKEIAKLLIKISRSVTSSIQHDNLDELNILLGKLFLFAEFATGDIKWIEELRERLYEKDPVVPPPPKGGKQRRMRNAKEEKYKDQLALKLSVLKSILSDRLSEKLISYKSDVKLKAVLEMLLLDIMSILGSSKGVLENNLLFLDDNTPLLNGKCLRNYLAHDNAVVDVLLSDPAVALILNAKKLMEVDIMTNKKKIGKFVGENPFILQETYHQKLATITDQKKMFLALEEGNLEMLQECLGKGTDINGRSSNLWTALHFAAKGPSLEVIKFIIGQHLSVHVKDSNGQSPLHVAAAYGRQNIVEFFVHEAGSRVDDPNNRGKTPLHFAAQNGHTDIVEVLLKNNVNTVTQDNDGFAPLHYAIKYNHIDIAKLLLEKDVNVDSNESVGGFTPLHSAAENGHLELVQFLLQNKADINAGTDKNYGPLHAAVINGHLDVVKTLILHGANVNNRIICGITPLHGAIEAADEKMANVLLKHGADVNAVDKIYNNTPLNYAARFGNIGIVNILLKNKANASVGTFTGQTPLHFAVRRNHLEIVTALLEHGVDVEAKTMNQSAPLHYAAECGHKEVAEILIKNGADIDDKAFDNCTPLHMAAEEGHKDVVDLLIKHKADVNAQTVKGFTPLFFAAMNGSKDIIDFLIKNKAEVHVRTNNNKTPLHTAALNGRGDAVDLLIKNEAGVNVVDTDGHTPLHYAACNGHIDVVNFLIQNGADVDVESLEDNTPLIMAVEAGHKEIVEILIANGANVNNVKANNATPLFFAIKNNHKEIVETLIANAANVNESVGDNLSIAVAIGYIDIVEILLKNKAMVNRKDPANSTPLHMAALLGNKKVVKALITNGADVDALTIENVTPVYFAAEGGHEDIVRILIASGANLNIKTDIDMNPLEVAITRGHSNVVNLLLANKVNITVKCNNRTPTELAVEHGHFEVVKMLLQYKNVDINARGDDGSTLLHLASGGNNLELIKFLVEEGCDINVRNAFGLQCIHIAAKEGYRDTVEFYLSKGFSIRDPGVDNQTLLHHATTKCNLDLVKYLIEQGADVNTQDSNGSTPLHFAANFGCKDCFKILLLNGAVHNPVNKFYIRPLEMAKDKDVINLLATTETLFEAVQRNSSLEVLNYIKAGAFVNAKNTESETPLHYAAQKGYDGVANVLLQNNANPNVADNKGLTPLHYAAQFSHLKVVKALLSNSAVYNAISDCGKTPSDFTINKSTTSLLLDLVDETFKTIKNGNPQVVHDLCKIRDIDTVKAIMGACNRENKTLVVVGMLNNCSNVDQLKQIAQEDVSVQIDLALDLLNRDHYREAFSIFQNAFEKRKEILGSDNPGTLDIQKHIVNVLYKQGFYQEALNTLEEIFQKQTEMLGLNYKDTLNTRSAIALVLHSQGKDEEAFNICKEVYEKQKEILGPNHPDTLDTQIYFALVLSRQEKYEEALNLNRVVFVKSKEISGADHPTTLQAENNIAMVLAKQSKFQKALKIYGEVFEKKKVVYGSNHSDTLRTLNNIGVIFFNQQKYVKALKTHQEVLNIQKSLLGPYHPDTLVSQYNIANVLFAQYKLIGSFRFYRKCIDHIKIVFAPEHPMVLDILKNIETIHRGFKHEGSHVSQILHILMQDIKIAVMNGDIQNVQNLLKDGANVNDKDIFGRTPLHYAVSNGHIDVVKILLQDGADVSIVCNQGKTPLQISTSKGYKKIAEVLLQHVSHNELNDWIKSKSSAGGCLDGTKS